MAIQHILGDRQLPGRAHSVGSYQTSDFIRIKVYLHPVGVQGVAQRTTDVATVTFAKRVLELYGAGQMGVGEWACLVVS